jgi:hypothetical protein
MIVPPFYVGPPICEKSWNLVPNLSCGTGDYQLVMWNLVVNALLVGAPACTVYKCCDSVNVVTGSSNWTTKANLVWSAGNHSWIVLNMVGTGQQLCIDLRNATRSKADVYVSPTAAFAGGAINTRPTAVDEWAVVTTATNWCSYAANCWLHYWVSSDGAVRRACLYGTEPYYGVDYYRVEHAFRFEVPRSAKTGWTDPIVCQFACQGTYAADQLTYDVLCNDAYSKGCRTYLNGAVRVLYLVTEGGAQMPVPWGLDSITPRPDLRSVFPVGLAITAVGARGFAGWLWDLWWTSMGDEVESSANTVYFPADGSRKFVQTIALVNPWFGDGVTAMRRC